jgi:hypothetical protein
MRDDIIQRGNANRKNNYFLKRSLALIIDRLSELSQILNKKTFRFHDAHSIQSHTKQWIALFKRKQTSKSDKSKNRRLSDQRRHRPANKRKVEKFVTNPVTNGLCSLIIALKDPKIEPTVPKCDTYDEKHINQPNTTRAFIQWPNVSFKTVPTYYT